MSVDVGITSATPRSLAWAFGACAVAFGCGLGWAALALTHTGDPRFRPFLLTDGRVVALDLAFALTGLFILVHRTLYGLGSLFLTVGALSSLTALAVPAAAVAGAGPGVADGLAVLQVASWAAYAVLVYGFPLWLPTGRLPGGAGRALLPLVVVWSVVYEFYLVAATTAWYGLPDPLRRGAWAGVERQLGTVVHPVYVQAPLTVALLALAVAAVRWLRPPRPPLRLLAVVVPYLLWLVAVFLPYLVPFELPWLYWVGTLGWIAGVAYGFTRDRETCLDRSTRRVLSAFVFVAVLILANALLGFVLLRLVPGAADAGARAVALVALAMGVLLRPTARGVVRAVDRYYYGERAHPYQVVRDLAERLSRAVDPGDAPGLLCTTVVRALGVPGAAVGIRTLGGCTELARAGECPAHAESLPLTYEGAQIGGLRVAPRPGQRALDPQDREVLRFLADQASPAIASLRLYEEIRTSRKAIVLAREEERRRLRHDLHDGLGPALSGLRLQVDTARACVADVPGRSAAEASLSRVSEGIGRAITELRRITDGLAPAALGSEGLTGALRQLANGMAGRDLRVALDLDPDPLPALPAAVEVAVYRISGEALNNIVRHSGATNATLVLRVDAGQVTVEARDDGAGFPAHTFEAGVGLRSMAERAEELGGAFTAANDAGGAVVTAVFPRAPEPAPVPTD
jgi:signal transduction histidine kinase